MAKTILSKALALFFLTLLISSSIFACADRALLFGRVTDGKRGIPRVRIVANNVSTATNALGYYTMYVPNCGSYHVTASTKWFQSEAEDIFLPVADSNAIEVNFQAR